MRIRWLYPDVLIFSIPNGGKRSKTEAVQLKKEGALKGIPDLFIAKQNRVYAGLFIEMKTEEGKLSPEQIIMHNKLKSEGYQVITAHSFDEAYEEFKNYIS